MSFVDELRKQKERLKETDTVVTNVDGKRYIEGRQQNIAVPPTHYGFVVDTKPDNVPVLIVDYLYIGSQDCAVDNKILEAHYITNVISLGIDVKVNVKHKFVRCLDLPDTDIEPVLVECLPFIHRAVTNKEYILIHCNAGVSRTSMVAIAYLQATGMEYEDAYNLVKSKRPAIQPNAGFKKQLKAMNFSAMI